MSELELLKKALDTLDGINVPVPLTEQIAIPVVYASNLIRALYNAVSAAAAKKEEAAKESENGEIQNERTE